MTMSRQITADASAALAYPPASFTRTESLPPCAADTLDAIPATSRYRLPAKETSRADPFGRTITRANVRPASM